MRQHSFYRAKKLLNSFRRQYRWNIEAKPERLWLVLNNTRRLAEILGLPAGRYVEQGAKGPLNVIARGGFFSRLLMPQWREPPVQWIDGRWLSISRRDSRGLIANISWTITLEREANGCSVRHDFSVEPQNSVSAIVLMVFGRPRLDRAISEAGRTLALWAKGATDHPFPKPRALPKHTQRALSDRAMLADGSEYGRGQVSRLARWMSQAQEEDTARIRPTTLASLWNISADEVAEILFAAVAAGILKKRWIVACSNCSGVISEVHSLKALKPAVRCPKCSSQIEIDLARNVEVAFVPNEDLIGFGSSYDLWNSPADYPAIAVRVGVEPKSKLATKWPASRSGFLAQVMGTGANTSVPAGAGNPRLSLSQGTLTVGVSDQSTGIIELVNHDGIGRYVTLGPIEPSERGFSARRTLLLQAHRDIGGEEIPKPDQPFILKNAAVLVTDLAGLATRYRKSGDATTFKAVSDLLRETTEIIRDFGGSVTSRLGELVVSVFPEPKKAVMAAAKLSAHNENLGLPASRAAIDTGELSAAAHKGRLIMRSPAIDQATAALRKIAKGEVALSNELIVAPGVIKLIQGYSLEPISDQEADGVKIVMGGKPTRNTDPNQSASAA